MPAFTWSTKQGRYQYRNGKAVPRETLGGWVSDAIESSQEEIDAQTRGLVDGVITVAAWLLFMRGVLRAGHRMMAQLAYGPSLSPKQLGRLGAIVKAQYRYLDAFTAAIENGDLPLTAGLATRAVMYAEAFWTTWQNETAAAQGDRGMTEILNVLDENAEHCDGCLEETARGWIPLGDEVPIGARDCLVRDRCSFEYR